MQAKEQELKASFNKELQEIVGRVKSYENSKKEYKRNLKNLKTFVQFCDTAMKREAENMNDGMHKLQSYGRRVDILRRQVGVLQTALARRNLVYRDLCTLYEVVFNTQAPRDIRDAMPELRGQFTALKKEKAILKQTLDTQRYSLHQKSKNIEQELKEELKEKEKQIQELRSGYERVQEELKKKCNELDQLNGENLLLQSELLKEKEKREEEVSQTKQSCTERYQVEIQEMNEESKKQKGMVENMTKKIEELEVVLEEKNILLLESKQREEKESVNYKRKLKEAKSARDAVLLTLKEKNQEILGLNMELEELHTTRTKEDRFIRTEDKRAKSYRVVEKPEFNQSERRGGVNQQLDELEEFANELLNDEDDD